METSFRKKPNYLSKVDLSPQKLPTWFHTLESNDSVTKRDWCYRNTRRWNSSPKVRLRSLGLVLCRPEFPAHIQAWHTLSRQHNQLHKGVQESRLLKSSTSGFLIGPVTERRQSVCVCPSNKGIRFHATSAVNVWSRQKTHVWMWEIEMTTLTFWLAQEKSMNAWQLKMV